MKKQCGSVLRIHILLQVLFRSGSHPNSMWKASRKEKQLSTHKATRVLPIVLHRYSQTQKNPTRITPFKSSWEEYYVPKTYPGPEYIPHHHKNFHKYQVKQLKLLPGYNLCTRVKSSTLHSYIHNLQTLEKHSNISIPGCTSQTPESNYPKPSPPGHDNHTRVQSKYTRIPKVRNSFKITSNHISRSKTKPSQLYTYTHIYTFKNIQN